MDDLNHGTHEDSSSEPTEEFDDHLVEIIQLEEDILPDINELFVNEVFSYKQSRAKS
jgi:hypothetical protein